MAGWKLRKDKDPAEMPGTDAEIAPPPEHSASNGSASGEPEFESGSDRHFTDLDFDDDKPSDAPAHDDGPLTLVDYTAPAPADATPDSWFLGASAMEAAAAAPSAPTAAVYETPSETPAAAEPDFASETDFGSSFSAPLPLAPLAAVPLAAEPPIEPMVPEFSAATPTVAPFVLDMPLPDAPPDAPPQLVVHFGRLSASFPLVKDVTTIGRPDSSLHYYPDVEIEMDDAVSRHHAEVVKRMDGYHLVDTGSTNGTLLNGDRLPSHEERPLMRGDRIKVGDRTEITFE